MVGLSNYKIPLAMEVAAGLGAGPRISIGTWLPEVSPPGVLEDHASILEAALSSLYVSIDLEETAPANLQAGTGGLVLGIPSIRPPESVDGSLPMDRLLRAMGGASWAALVLALPVHEEDIRSWRLRVLNEMRGVMDAPLDAGRRPLAEHYVELLRLSLGHLTTGQGTGLWRTAVYLAGDRSSFYRLAAVWRGIFSGPKSLPEPIRVFDDPAADDLIEDWAMPDLAGEEPRHGYLRHPFAHQTPLNSTQLAAYVHFPRLETSGFSVRLAADFDAVPAEVTGERIALGRVIERDQVTPTEVTVARDELSSHVFVTGVTGAGKTNTVFQILTQAFETGVPFLVIEPAKTEYRALLEHEGFAQSLDVFTLGNERVSPLRLNPFEFPARTATTDGVPVGVHLDLMRSVFNASFGMWAPLPQVLEVCLQEVYEDRGWHLATDTNHRLGPNDDRAPAFPTLSELVAKVDDVTGRLGYDERITADIRAALRTRLNSLRSGAKGRMLDVRRSLPLNRIFSRPTVVELEGLGDDEDKAFVMGLLIVALAEHRRVQGPSSSLQHLLVIEEAHRLLANAAGPVREGESDVRGKAVDTFTNLLAEVRAYGQGVMVVDQIPSKLAPDVMKNTSTKVAHRIVASDDRDALAAAMAMSERQHRALASLDTGVAAVFVAGADAPLLAMINEVDTKSRSAVISDQHVRSRMADHRVALGFPVDKRDTLEQPTDDSRTFEAARDVVETAGFQRVFARVVLSLIEDAASLDRLWPELLATISPRRPPKLDETKFVGKLGDLAAELLADRRGAQAEWTYTETTGFSARLRAALAAKLEGTETTDPIDEFRVYARTLHARPRDPFFACSHICQQQPPVCLYRHPAADLIAGAELTPAWRAAERQDLEDAEGDRRRTWQVSLDAAYALIEFKPNAAGGEVQDRVDEAARRTGLCFGQQMLFSERERYPRNALIAIDALQLEAGRVHR